MDINRDNMLNFFLEIQSQFSDGLNAKRDNLILGKVAQQVQSNAAQTVHGWLNQIPSVREWIGDRIVKNIQSNKLTITNRIFESTIEIPRVDVEDDLHRLYLNNANYMGMNAVAFKDELLVEQLLQGLTNKWADDVANFSAAGRSYDGTNAICNYTTTAYTEDGSALNTAYAQQTSYLGHSGKPLMVRPRYILHGPLLRTRVQKSLSTYGALLASATQVGGQIVNPNANLVEAIETPYLVNGYVDSKGTSYNAGYYWFVLGEVAGIRGLVLQERAAPEMQMQRAQLDSEFLMNTDKFQYGCRSRAAAFISLPHLVHANLGTA